MRPWRDYTTESSGGGDDRWPPCGKTSAPDAEVFDFALDSLLRAKKIESVGELVRLPGRGVVMKDEESESRKVIEQTFAAAGLKVPALKDVLAGLKIDQARAHKIMTLLLREKILIKVSDDLVFHQSALAELRKNLAAAKTDFPATRRGPLQGPHRSQPEVCHTAAGVFGPGAGDETGGG